MPSNFAGSIWARAPSAAGDCGRTRHTRGRIATRRLDYGRFDHGAQYFTARDLARELTVSAGIRIVSVRRVDAKWTLVADDGFEASDFDLLVSAVPAPQAPPFLTASTEFTLHAQRARFKPCHALMIRFEAPVEVDFDAAFVKQSALGWVAHDSSKPSRETANAWGMHSTAEWSRANLDRQADDVLEMLTEEFATALARKLPGVTGAAVHRWLYARVVDPRPESRLWDAAQGLGVCGDWLQGDRIEDAFLSAQRLAEAIRASRADRVTV